MEEKEKDSMDESDEESSNSNSINSSSQSSDSDSESPSEKSESKEDSLKIEEPEEDEEDLEDHKGQTQYQFPGLTFEEYLKREKEIVDSCRENNILYIDENFPADLRSIYRSQNSIPEWGRDVKNVRWLRPNEIIKDPKFMLEKDWDIKHGALAESWFIGAIIIISGKGDFIDKLIVESSYFDLGFVSFQFFKNGVWNQVIVDTLLPYDPDSKQVLYGQCANPNEFWVALMEKAYTKIHENYEVQTLTQNVVNMSLVDGLVDLTGGLSENWNLHSPETQKKIENDQLWNTLTNYFNQKYLLGCANTVEGKFPKHNNLRLIRIRNPWGPDGAWNGPFSDDSEEWDKHRDLRDELKQVFKTKKSDGNWWMAFNDWCVHFNNFYICKVFPSNWQSYSIGGEWAGKSAGGLCPPKMEYEKDKQIPPFLQLDSDDKWFNNPQFRIRIKKDCKLFISLMQEDKDISKNVYIKTNFMICENRMKRERIWERPDSAFIIADAQAKLKENLSTIQREITISTQLKVFEGRKYGYYMIIPNTLADLKKDEVRKFWLRVFSSEEIEVCEMPETFEKTIEGSWETENLGKRRKMEGKDNPEWCKNPQYFLNLEQPTYLKIILRRTGNTRKNKDVRIGLTVTRFLECADSKVLLAAKNPNSNVGTSLYFQSDLNRLLAQTDSQLEAPQMLEMERKIKIHKNENFKESSFYSDEVACLFFKWHPSEGPFIVIPSMDTKDKLATFKISSLFSHLVFSNKPLNLLSLDPMKNHVTIGEWKSEISDGGSHLYDAPYEKKSSKRTWSINPKYFLQFKETFGSAKLKITLVIAEKDWKRRTVV